MQIAISKNWLDINPAEKLVLKISLLLIALNGAQVFWRGINIDFAAYTSVFAIALGCFSLGQFYRISGRSPRIGLALVCTGVFTLFSPMAIVFNYLMMPISSKPIDSTLVWLDSFFGYHWPSLIEWVAEHLLINEILRYTYMSTMPQIGAMIIILGMSGRARQLHSILVSMVITTIMAIVFWGFIPSHGTTAVHELAPAIEKLVDPFVATAYGKELLQLALEGPELITPSNVKGLIAFPSYHIVLACTALYAMRNIKYVSVIYLVVNILMLPATAVHGGHHLVDIFAGIILFIIGTVIAEKTVAKMYREGGHDDFLEADLQPARAAKSQEA